MNTLDCLVLSSSCIPLLIFHKELHGETTFRINRLLVDQPRKGFKKRNISINNLQRCNVKKGNFLFYLAVAIFLCGLIFLGKVLNQWITSSPLEETAGIEIKGEKTSEEKPVLDRDQTPILWRKNPFSLTDEGLNDLPETLVASGFVLKGTIIGASKTAVLVVKENPSESYLVREGDTVLQEKIVTIKQGQVILLKDGRLLTLFQEE